MLTQALILRLLLHLNRDMSDWEELVDSMKNIDFEPDEIRTMVEEHRELYDEVAPLARDTNAKVTLLVDDMYGAPHPTAADPDARDGGWVPVLRSLQQDGVQIRKTWDKPQWWFFGSIGGTFISTCGVIIVAIIGG